MAATIKIPTEFLAIDKFSKVVSKMTKGVQSFSRKSVAAVNRFDAKVTKSFKKLGRLGQMALGLGIGAIFTLAIANNIAYEDSLASVSAITGAVGDDLIELEQLSMNTAKASKMLGADVLKAYELVGSAKPELLKNAEALDGVTRSVITLSKASRMEMADAAKSLTDVMNQFNIVGSESGMVIDTLAAGAKFGAAAIPQISEAIVQFGTVAKQSNISLFESVAAIEVFAAKGIKGAEAGTKMRNVLTTLATAKALPRKALTELAKFGVNLDIVSDKSLPLNERLKEMSKIGGDATAMVKVFGKENQGAGSILLNNIGLLEELTTNVKEGGIAEEQAAANTNTFKFALDSIKTSFLNVTTATQGNNKTLETLKKVLFAVGENMGTIITVAGVLIGAWLAMKIMIIAVNVVSTINAVITGIQAARQGTLTKAVVASNIATKAYAAAQWVLNVALNANPIGLIIIAIAALIGLVALIINKYDDWGASLTLLLGPLGFIINLIQSFRRNWDMVKKAFSEGGLLAGLKAIGAVLIDAVLMPIQQLLELLSNIPGLGGLAGKGAEFISEIRGNLGVDTGEETEDDVLPSTAQASNTQLSESIEKSKLNIDIRDKGNNVEKVSQSSGSEEIPINITDTVGAF